MKFYLKTTLALAVCALSIQMSSMTALLADESLILPETSTVSDAVIKTVSDLKNRYPTKVLRRSIPTSQGGFFTQDLVLVGADEIPMTPFILPVAFIQPTSTYTQYAKTLGIAFLTFRALGHLQSAKDPSYLPLRLLYFFTSRWAGNSIEVSDSYLRFILPVAWYSYSNRVISATENTHLAVIQNKEFIPEIIIIVPSNLIKSVNKRLIRQFGYKPMIIPLKD